METLSTLPRLRPNRPPRWQILSNSLHDLEPITPTRARVAWSNEHTSQHGHREIMINLSGQGDFGIWGEWYPFDVGSAFFIDRGERHDSGFPKSAGDATQLWISVLPNHIGLACVTIRDGITQAHDSTRTVLTQVELGLDLESIWPSSSTESMHESYLPVLHGRLSGALTILYATACSHLQDEQTQNAHEFQETIINAIQSHLDDSCGCGDTIASLACIAGYSRYHFMRLFQTHTGYTVHEYINQCRIRLVAEMLDQGRMQKQISERLGFSCPQAFSRWLRKHKHLL